VPRALGCSRIHSSNVLEEPQVPVPPWEAAATETSRGTTEAQHRQATERQTQPNHPPHATGILYTIALLLPFPCQGRVRARVCGSYSRTFECVRCPHMHSTFLSSFFFFFSTVPCVAKGAQLLIPCTSMSHVYVSSNRSRENKTSLDLNYFAVAKTISTNACPGMISCRPRSGLRICMVLYSSAVNCCDARRRTLGSADITGAACKAGTGPMPIHKLSEMLRSRGR
jgi:hypothetical protein